MVYNTDIIRKKLRQIEEDQMKISIATKSKIIMPSLFSGYDACINTYVGCQYGCSYCYVRFFIKDDEHDWGDFVRIREHIKTKLPRELSTGQVRIPNGKILNQETGKNVKQYRNISISETRLVLGTMTDPYQPIERKYRITRETLKKLTDPRYPQFQKVGIFTRSPIILDDLELIAKLPKARVHFTITPIPPEARRIIEPFSSILQRRWDTVKKLKEAGIRVHCNISPIIPMLSEQYIEEFVQKLAELQVDEYFVDPMQPYKESFQSFQIACQKLGLNWSEIANIMQNKERYLDWKAEYFARWNTERIKYNISDQLPIWCDHENKVWVNMNTMQQMNQRNYD